MEFYPVLPADAIRAERGPGGAPTGVVAVRPADLPRERGIGAGGRGRRGARGRGSGVLPSGGGGAGGGPPGRGGAAAGWLPDHVTLGVLEACLPAGEIEELVEDFGCWERRRRLLSAAMAVRLLVAAALIPDWGIPEVIHRMAGLLELLPWARHWRAHRHRGADPPPGPDPGRAVRSAVLAGDKAGHRAGRSRG